jgi:hypothetical protein
VREQWIEMYSALVDGRRAIDADLLPTARA